MKLKFIGTLAVVALASTFAFSQANSSAALPSAPGAANDPPPPALNFNANAGTSAGAFNQGHNLHKLTLSAASNYVIPVFPPTC